MCAVGVSVCKSDITSQFSNLSTSLRLLFVVVWLPATQNHSKFRRVSHFRFQREDSKYRLVVRLEPIGIQYLHQYFSNFFESMIKSICASEHLQDASSCIVCTNPDLSLCPSKCSSPSSRNLAEQRAMRVRASIVCVRRCVRSWYRLSHMLIVCQSIKARTEVSTPDQMLPQSVSHGILNVRKKLFRNLPIFFLKYSPSVSAAVHLLDSSSFRLSAPPLMYDDCWASQSLPSIRSA